MARLYRKKETVAEGIFKWEKSDGSLDTEHEGELCPKSAESYEQSPSEEVESVSTNTYV